MLVEELELGIAKEEDAPQYQGFASVRVFLRVRQAQCRSPVELDVNSDRLSPAPAEYYPFVNLELFSKGFDVCDYTVSLETGCYSPRSHVVLSRSSAVLFVNR
jgi:hypothetical protein